MSADLDRRTQILVAAERLLTHYGPTKTTMAEIAHEAAIGVGTVYLEFCSKDAIIVELSRRRHSSVLSAMRAASTGEHGSYASRIRSAIDAKVETLLAFGDRGNHAADLVHCAKDAVQTAHSEFLAQERALVAELISEGNSVREFEVDDAAETACVMLRAYVSFSPPWLYKNPRDEVRSTLRSMHRIVFEGLLRRSEPHPARLR